MTTPFVAILMGSDSDLPVMQAGIDVLAELGIRTEVRVTSAHRTPERTRNYVEDADARGCAAFICGAGMAAHLAGAVAAHTTRPVIGVPIDNGPLQGFDALLSTVQMPAGIPVATVAVGKAGAANAGFLAAQLMALSDDALDQRVRADREARARKVAEKDAALNDHRG